MKRIVVAMLGVAAVAGCKPADDSRTKEDQVVASGFVPPVTQAPKPMAGQSNATPLTAYVGHEPGDAVAGVSFFDRTEVANALIDIVPEAPLRHEITGRDVTSVPVFQQADRVAVHGCAPHDCSDRNWTVFIPVDGNVEKAEACYHDAAAMADRSRWSTRTATHMRPGACPQA